MTVGELLDAATTLLRTRAPMLLGAGFLVALVEQLALFPLRQRADVTYLIFPAEHRWGSYALLLLAGFATELFSVTALGAYAAAAAPRALLGTAGPVRRVPVVRAAVLAVVVTLVGAAAWLTVVGGVLVHLLLGLAMPVLVIERTGPVAALSRSVRLSTRHGLRVGWIRLLGYTSWLFIRLATGIAGWTALGLLVDTGTATRDHLIAGLAWLLVNSLAYPTLACLDAVLLLDIRMRTEGLDLSLRRTLSRRVSCESALAVPR